MNSYAAIEHEQQTFTNQKAPSGAFFYGCGKGIAGMSWSLDKSVARKFGGVLSQRVVTEDELLCCVGGYEQEVILEMCNRALPLNRAY